MGTPFLSEIRIMSFDFAPKGWMQCNGQLLPINQYQSLFAVIGTTYGGDGRVNFALPDLRGRVPVSVGLGFKIGQAGGALTETLDHDEMAKHTHPFLADGAEASVNTNVPTTSSVLGRSSGKITPSGSFNVAIYSTLKPTSNLAPQVVSFIGGNQPHQNAQPYLALNYCISMQGITPSPN